jgi:hypothetical protein
MARWRACSAFVFPLKRGSRMTNFASDHGTRILELLERALGEIADPQKSLRETISSDNEAIDFLQSEKIDARGSVS